MKCKKCGNDREFLFYLDRCVEVHCEDGKPSEAAPGSEELTDIACRECNSEEVLVSEQEKELFWEVY